MSPRGKYSPGQSHRVVSPQIAAAARAYCTLLFVKPTATMSGVLFEDIFEIGKLNPDGKKFDRGKGILKNVAWRDDHLVDIQCAPGMSNHMRCLEIYA